MTTKTRFISAVSECIIKARHECAVHMEPVHQKRIDFSPPVPDVSCAGFLYSIHEHHSKKLADNLNSHHSIKKEVAVRNNDWFSLPHNRLQGPLPFWLHDSAHSSSETARSWSDGSKVHVEGQMTPNRRKTSLVVCH